MFNECAYVQKESEAVIELLLNYQKKTLTYYVHLFLIRTIKETYLQETY
jgi:hypothetical protein